ncbi:cadmium-translocating P-type ATPase [Sesbania bispinosa]|nr:cadmium-translocating P-type ATPase [Sesbania bispinosa]
MEKCNTRMTVQWRWAGGARWRDAVGCEEDGGDDGSGSLPVTEAASLAARGSHAVVLALLDAQEERTLRAQRRKREGNGVAAAAVDGVRGETSLGVNGRIAECGEDGVVWELCKGPTSLEFSLFN